MHARARILDMSTNKVCLVILSRCLVNCLVLSVPKCAPVSAAVFRVVASTDRERNS
jgi:hypothetical protein